MSELFIDFLGGGWLSAARFGMSRSHESPVIVGDSLDLQSAESYCAPLPTRYGRFDLFAKAGFLAMAIALRDAGYGAGRADHSTAIIFSTRYDSLRTDFEYYRTTEENEGAFSSPGIFPYTLPVLVAGEAASFFQLHGPTFSVGDDGSPGFKALECAALQLLDDTQMKVLTGWVDTPPDSDSDRPAGAIFVLLAAAAPEQTTPPEYRMDFSQRALVHVLSGKSIRSLSDFFHNREESQ